jgi:hypothetical protein
MVLPSYEQITGIIVGLSMELPVDIQVVVAKEDKMVLEQP